MNVRPRPDARDERGFTLVEMLVAMLAGIIVLSAILGVLEISVRLSARAVDRVDATQRGRTGMEQIVQLLHSSCVASSVTPVYGASDGSNLVFVSQFGSAVTLIPNLHKITFAGGNLTDNVYAYTGTAGAAPPWPTTSFASTPTSSRVLITNVSAGANPVFRYFKYVNGTLSSTALTTPLSTSDAAATTAVEITFSVSPSSGSTEARRIVNLDDMAVLRYVPASGDANVVNTPCQ
jgi:Tfp pilus assembly protein PilW